MPNNNYLEGAYAGGITFFGLPMQQNILAPLSLDNLIKTVCPARIIEIGTALGGLSVLFRLCNAEFVTYDIEDVRFDKGLFDSLGIDFRLADCFEREKEIADLIQKEGTTLLFCDGGDKPKEFKTFARYLKPGDVICAHDYAPEDPTFWRWEEIDDSVLTPELGVEKFLVDNMRPAAWLCCKKLPTTDSLTNGQPRTRVAVKRNMGGI